MRDWPLLDEAIDAKLDQQGRFVAWWGQAVRPAGKPVISQERGKLAMGEAEAHEVAQQVNHLNNRNAWRAICQALGNAGIRPGPGFGQCAACRR